MCAFFLYIHILIASNGEFTKREEKSYCVDFMFDCAKRRMSEATDWENEKNTNKFETLTSSQQKLLETDFGRIIRNLT